MNNYIDVDFENIRIDKVVAEFDVWDNNVPNAKYKVKVYEGKNKRFTAYTNLQVKDIDGTPYSGVGHGDNIDAALKDVVLYFTQMYKERPLTEEDFCYVDPSDF